MSLQTRRQLLQATSSLALAGTWSSFAGCAAAGATLPAVFASSVAETLSLVLNLLGTTAAVGSFAYAAGQMPSSTKQEHSYKVKEENLTGSFGTAVADRNTKFQTPVTAVKSPSSKRFLLMQLNDAYSHYNLLYNPLSKETYRVRSEVIDFLLADDQCDRYPCNHTEFRECGHDGCKVWIMAQEFINPGDISKAELVVWLRDEHATTDVLTLHAGHSNPIPKCRETAPCGKDVPVTIVQ